MDQNKLKSLETENKELQDLCGYLNEAYIRSKKESSEWQNLGCFTADILRDEISRYQGMDKAIKDQVERLVKENRELQEMCIVLDQSQGARQERGLTPPEAAAAVVYGDLVGEMTKHQSRLPHYSGQTRRTELKDNQAIERGVFSEYSKEMALVKMKQRLERSEAEKIELIKSLSAAHLLAADGYKANAASAGSNSSMPPALHSQWERVKELKTTRKDNSEIDSPDQGQEAVISPDLIMNAVTLLDIVRRLEAAIARGFSDAAEEAEAVVLRLLVNIAWQKIQEKLSRPLTDSA